jgi:hypothetical protein
MESPPQQNDPSKRFRWVGRPSEEELLGLPGHPSRHARVSFLPQPAPQLRPPAESTPRVDTARRRLHARDVIAIVAVGVAASFAFDEAGTGLPFRQGSPVAPMKVADIGATQVAFDRGELASLPRQPDNAPGRTATPRNGDPKGGSGSGSGSSSGSGSGSNDDLKNPSPSGMKKPPLVEATLRVVGTVTVEQPDVRLPDGTPIFPDVDGTLPPTTTVPLP